MIVKAFIVVLFCFIIEEKGLEKTRSRGKEAERFRKDSAAMGGGRKV